MNRQQARNERCDALSVWILGVWAGALVMTGVSAAVIFPQTREMGAVVPRLLLPEAEHWKFIAGRVQNRVFVVSDWLQLACGVAVLGLLLAVVAGGRFREVPRTLWRVRVGLALVTLATLAVYLAWLAPAMQTQLQAFWAALDAGNLEAARTAQAAFDRYHPLANRFFTAISLGVIGLGAVTALGVGRGWLRRENW